MPMDSLSLEVLRHEGKFMSDDRRVIARFFHLSPERVIRIYERVLSLSAQETTEMLDIVLRDFGPRHRRFKDILLSHYERALHLLPRDSINLRTERKMLIGAYFTMEYAFESAALFNPSIVAHPDQTGLKDGEVRFILSLRATGEGHVSSIVFREGKMGVDGKIHLEECSPYASRVRPQRDPNYHKELFQLKLVEMGAFNIATSSILEKLGAKFSYRNLEQAIKEVREQKYVPMEMEEAANTITWLAKSNYELNYPEDLPASEVVIFPATANESKGIEDVRMCRFVDDDGEVTYYGTYTAYNGSRILPQMLETKDFRQFHISTLNGACVQNKGIALFPRRIDGRYMMIGRLDGENLYTMISDNVYFWNKAEMLQEPKEHWEYVQIGNCGSPIETEEGWILLTHGVGPMRKYCIGAMLLDLDEPDKVIGHLRLPMLAPNENERDGYVPNVVYSCGAMVHGDQLIMPYAMSDSASSFATVSMDELLDKLMRSPL